MKQEKKIALHIALLKDCSEQELPIRGLCLGLSDVGMEIPTQFSTLKKANYKTVQANGNIHTILDS